MGRGTHRERGYKLKESFLFREFDYLASYLVRIKVQIIRINDHKNELKLSEYWFPRESNFHIYTWL